MNAPEPLPTLLRHNAELLGQAIALADAYLHRPGAAFAQGAGPHLRHVIEHYEALLHPANDGVVDYDARARDRALERDPGLAIARLQRIEPALRELPANRWHATVQVRGLVGSGGQWAVAVTSTLMRELLFVASHATHHFALLRAHCQAQGIAVAHDFGLAPATVAHARRHAALTDMTTHQETSCPAP